MPVTVAVEPYTACHRGERHNSTSSTSSTTTTAGAEFVNGKQPCGGESTESIPTRLVGVVPRPAANPMRFVASGRAPLLRSASEQLQKVERVKQEIHAPLKEEEPAEWQNNLDNWKSSRRKRQEDVIERLSEVKRLEEQGHNDPRRPNKTFGQIMQQRNKRGGSGGRVLQVYTDDENDIASMLASLRPAGPPQSSASSSTETPTTATMLGSRVGDNRSDAGFNTGSDTSSEPSDQPESEDKVLRRDISTGADAGYQAVPAGQSAAQSCSGNVLSGTCVETSCRPSLCSLSPSTAIVSKLTAGVGQDDSGTDECTCESAVRGYLNFADQRVVDCWRHSPENLDCHVIQDDDGQDSIHDDDDEDDDGVEGHQLVDTADLPGAVFDSDASSLSASRVAAAVSSRVLGQQPSSLAGERHFSCSALKRRARSLSVESGPEERQSACLSATDNVRLRRSEMTVTSSRAVPGREDVARRRSLFEPQSFASSTCSTSPVTASSVGPKVSETDDILKQLSEKGGLKQRIASLPLQSTESVVMSCVGADQSRGHGTSSGCSRDQAASTGDSSFRQKVALFSQTEPGEPSSSCRRGVSVSGEDGKCEREADRHHSRDRSKRSLSVDHLSSNNTAGDVTAVNHDGVEDAQSPHAQLSAVDLKLRFEQLATAAEKELAAAAAAASNQQHARRTSSTSASNNNNNIKKRDRASVQQSCSGSSQARQEHADSAPCKSLGDSVVKPLSSGCQSSNNDISTTRPVSTAIKSPLQHASDNQLSTTVSQTDEHVEGEGSTVLDLTGADTGRGAAPPSEKPPPPPGVPSTSRVAGSNHSAVNTQLRSPAEIREDLLRRKFDFLGIQECSVKPACDQTCQVDEELDRQEREIIEGLEREENWRLQQQAKYRSRLSKMSASSAGPPSSPNISPPVTDTRSWSQSQQCLSSSLLPATTSSAIVASAPQSASVADNTAASLPYSRSIPNLTSCDVLQHQTQASSSRGVDQHHRQSSLCGGGSVVTTRDQYPDRQTNKPAAGMQAGAGRSILRHDALQQKHQQPRRRIDPNRDPSQHWLIQEAEHRRIREFRERESVRKSQSLPHGVVAGAQATPPFQASTNGHRVLSRQSPPTNNGHMTSHDDVTFASTQNNIGRPISEEAALFGRASTNQQPPSLHHAHSPTNQMASSMFHQPIGARVSADAELPHSQPQSQPIYENTQHLSGKRSTPPFNNRGQMGTVSESRFNCVSPSSSSCSSHVRAATSGVTAAGGSGGVEDKVLSVSGRKQCSHCLSELGRGAAMIIESLQLFYHIGCFRCCVCNVQLGNGTAGADVRVRNNSLHCHDCYSNDQGVKFSKV